jgi:hypothetical protein
MKSDDNITWQAVAGVAIVCASIVAIVYILAA